ncbi:MAG: hypothetical protein ABI988_12090 [Nitrospirota bacterium]
MKQLRLVCEVADLPIQATDGEIGSGQEMYIDDQSWQITRACVEV